MALMNDTPKLSLLINVISGFCHVYIVAKENLKNQLTKWPLRKPVHNLKQSVDGKQSENTIKLLGGSSSHGHVGVHFMGRL